MQSSLIHDSNICNKLWLKKRKGLDNLNRLIKIKQLLSGNYNSLQKFLIFFKFIVFSTMIALEFKLWLMINFH